VNTRPGERLDLVTDFATLREYMIVVIKPCGRCGAQHRGMLFNENTNPVTAVSGATVTDGARTFQVLPSAPCCSAPSCISATSKWKGNLFRVVDENQADATATKTRALERVR
jgi:hypothetical protein